MKALVVLVVVRQFVFLHRHLQHNQNQTYQLKMMLVIRTYLHKEGF
jgi:hypothetical protein